MNRLIVSKKCKVPGVTVFFILLFVFTGATPLFTNTGKPFNASDTEEAIFYLYTVVWPIVSLIMVAVMLGCISRYSKAYIAIYDDHIEGIGINDGFLGKLGNTASAFHYARSDKYTATLSGKSICIDCNGAKHHLNFEEHDAKEVYDLLSGKAASPAGDRPIHTLDTITVTCPKCGVKCKYPVGHGEVILTCPKCGCKVRAKV